MLQRISGVRWRSDGRGLEGEALYLVVVALTLVTTNLQLGFLNRAVYSLKHFLFVCLCGCTDISSSFGFLWPVFNVDGI